MTMVKSFLDAILMESLRDPFPTKDQWYGRVKEHLIMDEEIHYHPWNRRIHMIKNDGTPVSENELIARVKVHFMREYMFSDDLRLRSLLYSLIDDCLTWEMHNYIVEESK